MTFFEKQRTKFQEDLSKAYLRSVCASQGILFFDHTDRDFDGTDCTLRFYSNEDKQRELLIQLKSTQNLNISNGSILFDIDSAVHNKLCENEYRATCLFVLEVNPNSNIWTELNGNELLLRHRMYYLEYSQQIATTNATTRRVSVPITNIVDPKDFLSKCNEMHDSWLNSKGGN